MQALIAGRSGAVCLAQDKPSICVTLPCRTDPAFGAVWAAETHVATEASSCQRSYRKANRKFPSRCQTFALSKQLASNSCGRRAGANREGPSAAGSDLHAHQDKGELSGSLQACSEPQAISLSASGARHDFCPSTSLHFTVMDSI